MTDSPAPRVLFYVQHLLGIGHLARASRIAGALAEAGFAVTMVTGGMPVPGFPGPGIDHVALPPVTSGDGFSDLVDAEGHPVDAAFKARRVEMLLDTCRRIAPQVVLVEAFPFGRRQMRFELLPMLDLLRGMAPRPLVLSSIRDILQQNRKPGRDEETLSILQDSFDGVLVHGDPGFVRLSGTYPLAGRITDRITYTGLVAPPPPGVPAERFDVVVSAGGGAVGGALIRASLDARRVMDPALTWCLIAGPNLPQPEYDALAADPGPGVSLFRFRRDFATLLAGARVSVSQAGYNTVCDILRAGCQAVLIPFTAGGETEQGLRAERLAQMGLASVLAEDGLTPGAVAGAVGAALARGRATRPPVDLEGAAHTADILRAMLAAR